LPRSTAHALSMGNTSQPTPGSLNAEAMIENRPDGPTQRTSRSRTIWTILAVIEVLLAATAVILDLLIPTIVILVLTTISLAIRRTGPASLGFHRVPRPGQMIISVFMLAIAWTVIQFSLTLPILNHLTGQRQNLNQFAGLQGNLGMLLIFLALTWTLAAVGEETVYRGYIPTRTGEVFGQQRAGIVLGVAVSSALFALAHTEQGVIGVIVTFLDALFFSALRWRFRTLWAAVLAHGFNNTIGLVTFFFAGPIYGLW
jgi:membrane protease YdiL (CAAX protease family)